MTQASDGVHDRGSVCVCDEETAEAFRRAVDRMKAAMPPGMTLEEFDQEYRRLVARGRWVAAWKLWRSSDREELRQAILDMEKLHDRFPWYVNGIRVPDESEREVLSAPPRKRKTIMQGIAAAFRGLAHAYPRLDRVLETAAARREEGQVFAEASRERRDELYRERVEWIAAEYRKVRGNYSPGTIGDKAARLEVAYAYSKVTGKKPMHDRSVCNILAAAEKAAARDHAETAG